MAVVKNWLELADLVNDESRLREWVYDVGLVPSQIQCPVCNKTLQVTGIGQNRPFGRFRCQQGHLYELSATKNTILHHRLISTSQFVRLAYSFINEETYDKTIAQCSDEHRIISRNTVADWFNLFREVCMEALYRRYANQPKIGGSQSVVEVDECKIGKRKCEMGQIVKGYWVIGMIDRQTEEVRLEICPDSQHSSETLETLIGRHVEPETTIITDCRTIIDCCKGRKKVAADNIQHTTGSSSLKFIDPKARHNTNLIKGQWRPLRRRVSRGGIQNLDMHLWEYLWLKDCKRFGKDPFSTLIEDIRLLYPGGPEALLDATSRCKRAKLTVQSSQDV